MFTRNLYEETEIISNALEKIANPVMKIIFDVLKYLLPIIVVILIIYIVINYVHMTKSEEPNKQLFHKKSVILAIIGIVICVIAYPIAYFITSSLIGDGENTKELITLASNLNNLSISNNISNIY
ncbi:Mbov_0395 family pilin-like conjugal transfer protein [Mycoplasma buteonis]|uniref:Mbov_0395 family pilin-like conjugal transfer protein n=1 Tax=Mycoplasma buteonis TaxID=171280 RepID=UPI00055E62DC|nr:hypothetical protein [Mycoplasma buteonis]